MNMRELPEFSRCSLLTPEGFFLTDEEEGRFNIDVDDEGFFVAAAGLRVGLGLPVIIFLKMAPSKPDS